MTVKCRFVVVIHLCGSCSRFFMRFGTKTLIIFTTWRTELCLICKKTAFIFLWPSLENAKSSPFMSLAAFSLILIHAFQSGLSFLSWQSLCCCKQISELCWEIQWRMNRSKLFSTVDYGSQVFALPLYYQIVFLQYQLSGSFFQCSLFKFTRLILV